MVSGSTCGATKSVRVATLAMCTAVMATLCTLGGFIMGVVPGIPIGFCPAVPVMVPFALWFGVYGVMATYIGCLFGGLMKGFPATIAIPWTIADVIEAAIPLLAFRLLKADPALKTRRDWVVFLAFAWLINGLVSSLFGSVAPVWLGMWTWNAVFWIWIQYFACTLVLVGAITPAILKTSTEFLKRTRAYVKGILR